MLFSEAKGKKVVSTSSADTVGAVAELLVDPATRSVKALLLKKTADGSALRWSDLTAFGSDAVTVDGPARITDPPEDVQALAGKHHAVLGKRVLSTGGVQLGKVKDVDFDPVSGALTSLELDDTSVAGARLLGVGSYAVVVADEEGPR